MSRRGSSPGKLVGRTLFYVLIAGVVLVILTPIYFLVAISFMSDREAYDWPLPLVPGFFTQFRLELSDPEEGLVLLSVYSNAQGKFVSIAESADLEYLESFTRRKTNCTLDQEYLQAQIEQVQQKMGQNQQLLEQGQQSVDELKGKMAKINAELVKTTRKLNLLTGAAGMEQMLKDTQAQLVQLKAQKEELDKQIAAVENQLAPLRSVEFRKPKNLLANYVTFFKVSADALMALFRSLQVALLTVLISLSIGGLAGYAFARYGFRGKNMLKISVLFVRMFPGIAIAMPMVVILAQMGFYDQPLGLSLVYSVGQIAMTIWITASIFLGIPVELEEAALVFGRSRAGAFFKITLPLALPGLAASAMYAFIGSWAETAQAIVLTQFNPTFPVVVYQTMVGAKGMINLVAAGGVAMALPAVLFTILIRKYILQMWGGVRV